MWEIWAQMGGFVLEDLSPRVHGNKSADTEFGRSRLRCTFIKRMKKALVGINSAVFRTCTKHCTCFLSPPEFDVLAYGKAGRE